MLKNTKQCFVVDFLQKTFLVFQYFRTFVAGSTTKEMKTSTMNIMRNNNSTRKSIPDARP